MRSLLHELGGRFADARMWRRALYLLLAFPIGIATFVATVTLLAVGASLVIVWVGVPILWLTFWLSRRWGAIERRLLATLVERPIVAPPEPVAEGGMGRRFMANLRDGTSWRAIVWQLARLPLGVLALIVVTLPLFGIAYIAAPRWGLIADGPAWAQALTAAGGVAAILLVPHLVDGLAAVHAAIARPLLGPSTRRRLAQATQRTAQAEARTDLARDLHDSVGHSVTAALLQASAARRVLESDPGSADRALAAVEEQGRAALEELDRVLAAIRDERAQATDAYGLDLVDELVAKVRAAGQPVSMRSHGDLSTVPAEVGKEGYRVLQEGLTNAMRHATGAPTDVDLDARADALVIAVRNEPGTAAIARPTGGRGLAGIAERVRPLGGTFEHGPTPEGGFALRAVLPYDVTGRV